MSRTAINIIYIVLTIFLLILINRGALEVTFMNWSLSFQLMPDEDVLEDSTQKQTSGIKSAYSIFLTNKRVIFRFDGLGSSLMQSFYYDEILDAKPCKRLLINYIQLKTEKREFLLNTFDTDYWSNKILEIKKRLSETSEKTKPAIPHLPEKKKREFFDMLTILKNNSLLTDKEFEKKVHQLDSMKL
jgi:hypothetical protein